MSGFGGIRLGGALRGRRVAVVHRRADMWSVVVGEVGEDARVIGAERVAYADVAGARAVIERHRAERVVRVAPGVATIARAVELPAGSEEEVSSAAALMAEAQLPGMVEWWRRGWGASPLGASEGNVGVLLVGWVGEAEEPALGVEEETWTSEVVGAAWLASLSEEGVCASGDRGLGSVVIAACAGGHGLVRTVREEGADGAAWGRVAPEAADEMGVRLSGDVAGERFVAVDSAAREAIAGMGGSGDDAWVSAHGIGVGVLVGMARGGAGALFELHAARPERRVGRLERVAEWVRRPSRAAGVIAAALVVMVLAPLGFAWAREAMLSARVEAIEEAMGGTDELQKRAAFYKVLEERRWPMTKLLADLAGAMPVGVQAESITLTVGDEISIRGTADEQKKLGAFTEALIESGVFSAGAPGDVRRSGEEYEFDLEVRARRPFAPARGLEDFAERSLGVRLYGEAYSAVEAKAAAEAEAREAERERRAARRRGSDVVFDGEGGRREASEPVPEALTDEQIREMDRSAVMKEFASRAKAAARGDIEDSQRERLKGEVEKLRGRLRELKGGG